MGNKLITDKGKTELLRLGFANSTTERGAFKYLALGNGDSKGAQGGVFSEVNGNNYSRVETTLDEELIGDEKEITISGVFEEVNCSPSDGQLISEIGLCNALTGGDTIFFLYSEVPEIYKTDSISLKYTIIISIE